MIRSVWKTRLGFYLAAMGSAFGLGSLWRFPYVVAENGGGAFVLLYVFLLFLIGTPILVGELLYGKLHRKSFLSANRVLRKSMAESGAHGGKASQRWLSFCGYFALALSIMVLSYYAVISGWVLHTFIQFVKSEFSETAVNVGSSFNRLEENGWLQIGLAGVHLFFVAVVVGKDVEEGIERAMGYTMPAFLILLVILMFQSLSMPTSGEALRFLLYPDFSQLSLSSLAMALGHVLFTLSIGFGTMVTFGSYLREKSRATVSGFRVTVMDSVISLFAGVLIFPLVLASGIQGSGLGLLFETVPRLLSDIPGGKIYGMGFFLCLYLAALGASIGLLETVVTNISEAFGIHRVRGAMLIACGCLILAVFPALSSSLLRNYQVNGRGILAMLDMILVNWLLPASAFLFCRVVLKHFEEKRIQDEFVNINSIKSTQSYKQWIVVMKYVVPAVISLAMLLQLIDLFL